MMPDGPDRLRALQEIRRLAVEQQGALRHGQLERFDALTEQRQAQIDALAEATPGGAATTAFPTGPLSETERAQALRVLVEILTVDQENASGLRTRVEGVRTSLGRVRRGHEAKRRYKPAAPARGGIERAG